MLPAMSTTTRGSDPEVQVQRRTGSDPIPHAIEVRGLRKAYGPVLALDGVDLTVRRGELLAVLGPNGAGKTTLVEILEGHRSATAGDVRVLGFDPARRERDFRERIGIVLQDGGLDDLLTVGEAVELYAAAYPDPRPAAEVLELVGLADRAGVRASELSGGQRRRLELALAIAGRPELIFLDEPTTGFDPAARRQSWELIAGLRELGTTILLTTHYLDEAQHLADRVVVVSGGRVIAEGAPDELGGTPEAIIGFRAPEGLPLPAGAEVDPRDGRVALRTATPTRDLAPLVAWAAERGVELEGLTVTRPSLEDVYLELTEETA
jgi:ABC-2 type transport system ATP-binding protein